MREKTEEKQEQWRATNLEHKDLNKKDERLEQENSCKTAILTTEVHGCREMQS